MAGRPWRLLLLILPPPWGPGLLPTSLRLPGMGRPFSGDAFAPAPAACVPCRLGFGRVRSMSSSWRAIHVCVKSAIDGFPSRHLLHRAPNGNAIESNPPREGSLSSLKIRCVRHPSLTTESRATEANAEAGRQSKNKAKALLPRIVVVGVFFFVLLSGGIIINQVEMNSCFLPRLLVTFHRILHPALRPVARSRSANPFRSALGKWVPAREAMYSQD